jgi:endonuclease YncB( thermonuclease family)
MRYFLCLLIFLTTAVAAQSAGTKPEIFKFEKVVDGATIIASGKTLSLWGVKAVDPSSPYSFASKLYLESMLNIGSLSCSEVSRAGDERVMHCHIDTADVGSLMVQMGMAMAGDHYYDAEQAYAQLQHRGVWKSDHGKSL